MEKQSDARPVHPRDQNVSKGSEPPVGGGSRSAGLTERWSALAARLLECRFSIADMARAQGLSVRQFERVFRRRFNCCPRHAAARLRMAIALQRLVTNARVKEIAAELGFYDSAHFCRAFHQYFGLRPSQLRRTLIKSRHTSIERERERTFCRGGPTCRSSTTKVAFLQESGLPGGVQVPRIRNVGCKSMDADCGSGEAFRPPSHDKAIN